MLAGGRRPRNKARAQLALLDPLGTPWPPAIQCGVGGLGRRNNAVTEDASSSPIGGGR